MLLFLDFDGVLHNDEVYLEPCNPMLTESERQFVTRGGRRVTGTNLFEHCDRLAAALEPFPNVSIVITSTWREHFDLDALKGFLPPALAEQVIGVTPQYFSRGGLLHRVREIDAFLRDNDLGWEPWIALDDQAYKFKGADHPFLLLLDCNEGLTAAAAVVFSQRLSEMLEGADV